MVLGGSAGGVHLVNMDSGDLLASPKMQDHEGPVMGLSGHMTLRHFVSCGADGMIKVLACCISPSPVLASCLPSCHIWSADEWQVGVPAAVVSFALPLLPCKRGTTYRPLHIAFMYVCWHAAYVHSFCRLPRLPNIGHIMQQTFLEQTMLATATKLLQLPKKCSCTAHISNILLNW